MNSRTYRKCIVCGKRICITLQPDGTYSNGYFFGRMKLPVKGTGKNIKIGRSKVLNADIVKWTGKEKEYEYWECKDCFNSD
ncbi:MAG: hypothetical protein KKD17_05485 [Nanoarchaeota archaeon]|nr:hypothetical protein [Nanoarchaeota archaeon]